MTQARMVETTLRNRSSGLQIETKIIRTSGDEPSDVAPAIKQPAGRKGLFTAEIERALLAGSIDVAVHSAKDLPSALNPGTRIAAVLPRAAVDDILVSPNDYDLESLPQNGRVATGSVRRRHQLRWKRPDLEVVDLRGNVPTRLRKLGREKWDGAILARAGLERLGLGTDNGRIQFEGSQLNISVLPADIFVPAGGQGIIAMQIRADNEVALTLLQAINHAETRLSLTAEREFLRLLEGDCNQPVGVFAIVTGNKMTMHGQVFRANAPAPQQAVVEGNVTDAEQLAAELLRRINDH